MSSLHRLNSGGRRGLIASCGFVCLLINGCAAVSPVSYSLEDSEIFVAPRPHALSIAVAVLEDRRSPEERAWASRFNLPSDLAGAVTERIVRHLRVSSVFSQIQTVSGPVDPTSPDRVHDLISQGADAVLMGDLIHFYGRQEPDHRIEGHVQFENLKLYSTHTGQLLWQGTADKLIQRQEKNPDRDIFYAAEALRGAINQLAIQLSGQSFSHHQVYPSELPAMRQWRVGVLSPEDLRPPEEKDVEVRKLKGDINYLLYSYDNKTITTPLIDAVAGQLTHKLQAADIYGNVLIIATRGVTSEELREWSEEGVDVVLVSRLAHAYASVTPTRENAPFPIWSGGIGYPRIFKATAITRIEDVQLIETRSGKLLWKGEAEYGIDRMIRTWGSPMKIVRESLSGALDRLVGQLSRYSPNPEEKPPVP
ncbi:MAG: hypothetical protein HY204_03560 [Nitrospirae bacterium]|nr:hypothetical protein [Nitrospirota bacterium]